MINMEHTEEKKLGKAIINVIVTEYKNFNNVVAENRVGEAGLFPASTSHTTVRTVRYTAVLYLRCTFAYISAKCTSVRQLSVIPM